MSARFESFYDNPSYRRYKKYLFNYLLRKKKISAFLEPEDAPVLDIGCGIAPMAPEGVNAFLGDKSFVAMKAMSTDGQRPVVLDIKSLGIQSNSVAAVICSEVLEHIDDDRQALKEIHRVLKPAGRLVVTVPLHRHYWRRDDEIVGHHRRYELDQLIDALRAAGFEVVQTAKVGSFFERYLTLAAVLAFLRTNQSEREMGALSLRLFIIANQALAHLLALASFLSPQKLTSVGLIYCRKKEHR